MQLSRLALLGALICVASCLADREDPRDEPHLGWQHQALVVCADDETVDGIDVSHWQETIDWDAVAGDGISFAIIRVSDGTYEDREFERNWPEARRVGIVRGVYQYFRPGTDPIVQADLLLSRMGELEPGDLPPVADVEDTDDQPRSVIVDRLRTWLDYIEAETGRVPIIYTGYYFWRDNVGTDEFEDHPLWIAQYGPECPNIPEPWTRWDLFQTSSSGRVAGIRGNVDTDLFNGSYDDLLAFAEGTVECGDGRCNGDETHESCPGDCPICEPIPPEGGIIDDADPLCFEPGGPSEWWHPEADGWEGGLIWTYCTDDPEAANYGVWHLDFVEAGRYLLEAYTDGDWAASTAAAYQVHHEGSTDVVRVNQSAVDGWNEVGEFAFSAGPDQWVRLDDNSGEPSADRVRIVCDAVRLTRLDPSPDGDADADVDVDADSDVDVDSDADADADVDADADADVDADADGDDDEPGGNPDWNDGCNCRVSGGASARSGALAVIALSALFGLRRVSRSR